MIFFFPELEQIITIFIWNQKKKKKNAQIVKAILRNKNKSGGTTLLVSDYTRKLQ